MDSQGGSWEPAFTITGAHPDQISLRQIDAKRFVLGDSMTIRYNGETGLEDLEDVSAEKIEEIRTLTADRLRGTDLASVPGILRWFTNTYGLHTPAALIHDWLIGAGRGSARVIDDRYADRYFRFMLHELGVPWLKRWIMWAAVALRTRWKSNILRKLTVFVWVIAAIAGLAALAGSIVALATDIELPGETEPLLVLAASLVGPFVFSVLWGKQYGAGLVASFVAPWILPPAVFAALGYVVYRVIELVASPFVRR